MGQMQGLPASSTDRSARGLIRGWGDAFARWLLGARSAEEANGPPAEPVARFRVVCISREAGAGGSTLGRMVASRLGWSLYDDEIVQTISQRMEVPVEEVKALDELSPSVIQDWLLPLREEHYAPLEAYLDHLAKLVLSIGEIGDAVIVGRGAGFMLPRSHILSVRVIASKKARAARLAERQNVSQRTARRMAADLDHRRDKFVRTMFRVDPSDPHRYDLVLDSESLGLAVSAEIVARAVEAGQPGLLSPPPPDGGVAMS